LRSLVWLSVLCQKNLMLRPLGAREKQEAGQGCGILPRLFRG
jgi:hypothetical protein